MRKIVLIVGARPNFIKAWSVYKSLVQTNIVVMIHTGQHYDNNMSRSIFDDLQLPYPNINLCTPNYPASEQIGFIITNLSEKLRVIEPDMVVVFGDVTSTLAGALCAHKIGVPVAHVESGLRSGDKSMPEEINRMLVDRVSDILFCTESSGYTNLINEKINKNIFLVGNSMIDTLLHFRDKAENLATWLDYGAVRDNYILVTLHRPSNVDDESKLISVMDQLINLQCVKIFPVHPRTAVKIEKIGYTQLLENSGVVLIEPQSYIRFLSLMIGADCVVTDSGGVQEETTALNTPCFTLRESTERPATLIENGGTSKLIDNITFDSLQPKVRKASTVYSDGTVGDKIAHIINIFLLDKK